MGLTEPDASARRPHRCGVLAAPLVAPVVDGCGLSGYFKPPALPEVSDFGEGHGEEFLGGVAEVAALFYLARSYPGGAGDLRA